MTDRGNVTLILFAMNWCSARKELTKAPFETVTDSDRVTVIKTEARGDIVVVGGDSIRFDSTDRQTVLLQQVQIHKRQEIIVESKVGMLDITRSYRFEIPNHRTSRQTR